MRSNTGKSIGVILLAAASKTIPMISIVAFVFVVYFGTATKWTFRPPWTVDYINPMAQALWQGRLDIPNPAMTYDLAFYNGRWYMTWGALAALVHVPFQILVGGRYVPALYTGLLFGSLTVVFVWLMLGRIRKYWFPEAPPWQTIFFSLLYAFGTMQYYLSTVGSIWQVNQVVSTFFGVVGTAVILKKKRSTWSYLLSSAFYGIALLGRPTVGLLIVIPLFLLLDEMRRGRQSVVIAWKRVAALLFPMALATVLLLAYNAARFGNVFETGHRFLTEAAELAAKRERYGMLSFAYLPTNAWHMIAAPARFTWRNGLTMSIDLMGNSIFFLSPILLLSLGTLSWIRSEKRAVAPLVVAMWGGVVITAAASLLYYNTGWMQFGYRYALDFSFLLLALAYIWLKGRVRWWMAPVFLYTFWVNYTGIRLLQ